MELTDYQPVFLHLFDGSLDPEISPPYSSRSDYGSAAIAGVGDSQHLALDGASGIQFNAAGADMFSVRTGEFTIVCGMRTTSGIAQFDTVVSAWDGSNFGAIRLECGDSAGRKMGIADPASSSFDGENSQAFTDDVDYVVAWRRQDGVTQPTGWLDVDGVGGLVEGTQNTDFADRDIQYGKDITIGCGHGGASGHWHGRIYWVALFDRALSDDLLQSDVWTKANLRAAYTRDNSADFDPPTIWLPDRKIKQGDERYLDFQGGPNARLLSDDFPCPPVESVSLWFNAPSTTTISYARVIEQGAYDGGGWLPGLSFVWNNLGPNLEVVIHSETAGFNFAQWAFTQNVWHHVVITRDETAGTNGEAQWWVNGVERGDSPKPVTITNTTTRKAKFGIARATDLSPSSGGGQELKIAHMAWWSRVVTPAEIRLLSNGANPLQITNKLFWYAPNGVTPIVGTKWTPTILGSPLVTDDKPSVDPIPRRYRNFNARQKQVTQRKWWKL